MAEAEDLITDAARHATVFAQQLWRRHRGDQRVAPDIPALLQRIDLFLAGSFGVNFRLRLSQPPAPVPFARRLFAREEFPRAREPLPATDGRSIWLPITADDGSIATLQILAVQQAARARRGAQHSVAAIDDPLTRAVFEVLEAHAADLDVLRMFPGMTVRIERMRRECLQSRPAVGDFPPLRRPLETWVRSVLSQPLAPEASNTDSLNRAHELAQELRRVGTPRTLLFRDRWTGELREADLQADSPRATASVDDEHDRPTRSAHMPRRPDVRMPDERDEQDSQGAWMVQTAQPHETAEDPFGTQRPTDRDEQQAAEEFADSLSELAEARLVTVPGVPREILLSEDAPPTSAKRDGATNPATGECVLRYPEWDWRARAYREPGAAVHLSSASPGLQAWVDRTLEEHRALLQAIRRQFESLRSQRTRLRQQFDGDELDLEACVEAFADLRAGHASERGLYQLTRTMQREMAILLLIDISGSTDGWVSQHRRIIDVEREALLLVCLALDSLGEPYSVQAFSGEGPQGVTVREIKSFAEPFTADVGLRIAGLEPEKYTRAGAAIRHATSLLMRERARHRLLLLLSDGKPNDMDEYDGRYGVEDMRQSVVEARLQGIFPFCVTIDRHTAGYLPAVFGEHQYAVLHRPDRLPGALVGWLRRMVQA